MRFPIWIWVLLATCALLLRFSMSLSDEAPPPVKVHGAAPLMLHPAEQTSASKPAAAARIAHAAGHADGKPSAAAAAHSAPASVTSSHRGVVVTRPRRECAPGCEKHGVCNSELGRCDCPPFFGGDDCSRPLFAACASAVGLREVTAAPCVYEGHPRVPVSCDCLMQCESIGLMGVRECYVTNPANATVESWIKHQKQVRGLVADYVYYAAALKQADAESVAKCSGRGVYAAPMVPGGGAPAVTAKRVCMCYAGFVGGRCETSSAPRPRSACLNGCNGRGECVRNWCHCRSGYYGTDCSLGQGPPGDSTPLPPRIGAQTDARAPRIYVYDLPPRFNAWMHAGEYGWWQDFDLWGEDVIIHRRMLASMCRVTNPEEADFFFVPIWVSSAMWQMNWGFRDLLPTGVRTVAEAASYVRQTWPYFDRHGGADHIWVFGHDQGAWRVRAKLPQIAAGIFVSPFGANESQRGGHRSRHDIVVPPVLYAHVPAGLINHAKRRRLPEQTLAFFQGKLNLHIPYEYSFGIRQGLYKAFRSKPSILVREGHEANKERYFEHMSGSKFCIAAAGFGFSTRAYEAATAGCIPLIMQDGIEQAFEDILPWGLFSLRMNNSLSAISTLDTTLAAVPQSRVDRMRSTLYCVWPRFLWLRHDPGAMYPLPGAQDLLKFDAFESLLWTLRKRLRNDMTWPSDWKEGCRAVRKYFEKSPHATVKEWAPWGNFELDKKVLEDYLK